MHLRTKRFRESSTTIKTHRLNKLSGGFHKICILDPHNVRFTHGPPTRLFSTQQSGRRPVCEMNISQFYTFPILHILSKTLVFLNKTMFFCAKHVLLNKNMFFCADPNSQRTKKTKKPNISDSGAKSMSPPGDLKNIVFWFSWFFWFPGNLVIHKTLVLLSKTMVFYANYWFY